MSHSFIFLRFKGGEIAATDEERLVEVLTEHGFRKVDLMEGVNEISAPIDESGDTPIGEIIITVADGSITEFSIDRPRYREGFRALSFDLVSRLGLAMLSDNGSSLFTSAKGAAELPDGFDSQFESAVLNVTDMGQLP